MYQIASAAVQGDFMVYRRAHSFRIAKKPSDSLSSASVQAEKEFALREKELNLKEQATRTARWSNPLVIAVLAAGLAGAGNAWVSHQNNANARSLEEIRWKQAVSSERERMLFASLTEFSKNIAKGHQLVTWLLWQRIHERQKFAQRSFRDYEVSMKETLLLIFSSHVHLATQDNELARNLSPLLDDIREINSEISTAFYAVPSSTDLVFVNLQAVFAMRQRHWRSGLQMQQIVLRPIDLQRKPQGVN